VKISENVTDEELLRQARRDADAFRVFYDRHAPRLLAWLRAETRDAWLAAELTAETFAQALT
jgi:DNA-directed RNA polymerase specialized sigma24 family protein